MKKKKLNLSLTWMEKYDIMWKDPIAPQSPKNKK